LQIGGDTLRTTALLGAEDVAIGAHLNLPQTDEAATPTLSFGTGTDGIYSNTTHQLTVAINGVSTYVLTAYYLGANATGGALSSAGATSTTPGIMPYRDDPDTGVGWAAANQLSLIAGGVESMRFSEASSAVLQAPQANVGLTADVGSAQGSGVITSSYNVYTTVGTAGDAATLPATAIVGTIVVIKNDAAANAMDVFPASGDDLGAGANTALSLAAGKGAMFLCTVANATWTNILTGI